MRRILPPGGISMVLVAATLAYSAGAQVGSGNSYGFGLQLNTGAGTGASLDLLGLGGTALIGATVNSSRLPSGASGTAPSAYDTGNVSVLQAFASGNLASVAGVSLGPIVGTSASAGVNLAGVSGTFNGRANSTVDGGVGGRLAHGYGSVENLRLDLVDLSLTADTLLISPVTVNPPPLLSFTQAANTTLSSDSTVSGVPGSFTRNGASVIADLGISVNGGANISLSSLLSAASISYTVDGQGNISVAPNTTLSLGVGASGAVWPGLGSGLIGGVSLGSGALLQLTLNRQVLDGDPQANPRITTTALEIKLSNLDLAVGVAGVASVDTVANLDIFLGQSQAQLAVPETATWMAGVGVAALAFCQWRRLRSKSGVTQAA